MATETLVGRLRRAEARIGYGELQVDYLKARIADLEPEFGRLLGILKLLNTLPLHTNQSNCSWIGRVTGTALYPPDSRQCPGCLVVLALEPHVTLPAPSDSNNAAISSEANP